jgi:thioredoxin reductase
VAILNDGAPAVHVAKLLRVLTTDVVVCTNGGNSLTEIERSALEIAGVKVNETTVHHIEGHDGQVEALVFEDGQRLERRAIFTRLTSTQHAPFVSQLGCAMASEHLVQVDEFSRTSVPGVYAAGDLANRFRQISMAVATGATAAAGINSELIAEDFIS